MCAEGFKNGCQSQAPFSFRQWHNCFLLTLVDHTTLFGSIGCLPCQVRIGEMRLLCTGRTLIAFVFRHPLLELVAVTVAVKTERWLHSSHLPSIYNCCDWLQIVHSPATEKRVKRVTSELTVCVCLPQVLLVTCLRGRTPTTPSTWPRGGTDRLSSCWGECGSEREKVIDSGIFWLLETIVSAIFEFDTMTVHIGLCVIL